METIQQKIKRLLESDQWTKEEEQWMLDYLESTDNPELEEIMRQKFDEAARQQNENPLNRDISSRILKNIHEKTGIETVPDHNRTRRIWLVRLAAACLLIGIATTIFIFINRGTNDTSTATVKTNPAPKKEIVPGTDGAILTFSNGKEIILDSAKNGMLSLQDDFRIIKQEGQIIVDPQAVPGEVSYNTLTTPRGRQFSLVLADGTKAWLNAASSIRFPNSFTGDERKVEITGEVYFEVVKDPAHPFKASVNGMDITVLGTHFNVNAYDDESSMITTLLEGSVEVSRNTDRMLLIPGQQAQLPGQGGIKLIKNADVDEAVAWKNGRFLFNSSDLKTIMRQISRWYNVDVVYEGTVSNRIFTGDLSRTTSLDTFLKVLEESDIHFRIEDGKLIVTR